MGTKKIAAKWLSVGLASSYFISCSQADSTQIAGKKLLSSEAKTEDASGAKDDPNTHPAVETPVDSNAGNTNPVSEVVPTPEALEVDKMKAENLALLSSGRLITQYNVTNTAGWGTSAANPVLVKVPVNAAGELIVPPVIPQDQQVPGMKDNLAGDTPFAGVNSLHAGIKFCNDSGAAIHLHSSARGPVNHGSSIATGTCQIMLVVRGVANNGSTYDHIRGAGNGSVFMKLVKILPDGSVMP